MSKAEYVYVASSWRNDMYTAVTAALTSAGIPHYNFRDKGFHWGDVDLNVREIDGVEVTEIDSYLRAINHPRAVEGFRRDMEALERASHVVLVLPCGRSSHLELGWAAGTGAETAILLEGGDMVRPELMYKMVNHLSTGIFDLLGWLGVQD